MTVRDFIVSKKFSMKDIDFIAIVSNDGVVLNPADQQAVWFGMHRLSEEFLGKEVAAFSVTECDDVFSRWEDGPLAKMKAMTLTFLKSPRNCQQK